VSLSVELIGDAAGFEALEPGWDDLLARMSRPEIFYSWAWTSHSWRTLRRGDELFVIVLRDRSRSIVAIAPLCIHRTRRFGIVVRVAETIARGLNDYSNIMVREDLHRERAVAAILDFMRVQGDRWDVLDLPEFNTRDSTSLHLLNLAPQYPDWSVRTLALGGGVAVRDLSRSPAVENSHGMRRTRNRMKALRSRGLRIEIASKDFDTYWPAFKTMHRSGWPTGAFADPAMERFFDALVADRSFRDHIDLSVVELDGRPVAMHFGFVDDHKVYYYMPVMDRSYRKEAVGRVMLYAMVEHYRKTRQIFDFMRGLESYKLWYTDELELNLRIVIYRSANPRALAYNLADIARRLGVELGFPKALARRFRG
jgi:CelD/BcsL family acetyltransferase involved in cellulose biosynthesis